MPQRTQSLNEDTEKRIEGKTELLAGGKSEAGARNQDDLTYRIIGAAMAVYSALGPGFFEKVYENALCHEFAKRGIRYQRQKRFRVQYDGVDIGELVVDLLIEDLVIVELKAAREPHSLTEAQVIGYLKAAGLKRGLVINFNVRSLKSGIKRISV